MSEPDTGESRKAVVVLEDQRPVLDAWVNALQAAMPDVYVLAAGTTDEAGAAIGRAEKEGCVLVLVLADQVLGRNREAGIDFLRQLKQSRPDARRVMVSGQSNLDEVQKMLDEGLVHHFQSKMVFEDDEQLPGEFVDKVAEMVTERRVGNVQDPDFEARFTELLKRYIKHLPEGEQTRIENLNGQTVEAGQILKDPKFVERLRLGYLTSRLDALLPER